MVNPAAGRGKAAVRWRSAEAHLSEHGVSTQTVVTEGSGDATVLTRKLLSDGVRTIIAVGGDGTVHEVVNGLYENGSIRDDVRLGIVPAGSGMDFARNLGARRGSNAAAERILRGKERRMDVGLSTGVQTRIFVNFAETGIGAAVVARQAQLHRDLPGRSAFFFAAIDAVREHVNLPCQIRVDHKLAYEGRLVSAVVANGAYFGGGMKIAPRATISDGLLDVVVLGDFSRLQLVAQIWKVYPGVHLQHTKVVWLQGRQIEIEPFGQSRLDLDGELFGSGPYGFSVLRSALRVLV